MDEPVVIEIPGTRYAVMVASVELATRPLPAEAVQVAGVGYAIPWQTAADVATVHLHRQGYEHVKTILTSKGGPSEYVEIYEKVPPT